jgi:phenylpropionate dioxygenase-like ring-hydroxylating dioxygenase large terminal subunit
LTTGKIDHLTCPQHGFEVNGRCTAMAKKKDKKDKDKKKKKSGKKK